jgi:glutathione peroxidase
VYTPQEAGLQVLEETFSAQGFHVLGFMSDDFGDQGGDDGQIAACQAEYGITYPEFAIADVVPVGTAMPQPVFAWIEAQTPSPGPDTNIMPSWNFSKYLISRTGELVAHWDSPVYPGADPTVPGSTFAASPIVIAIEAELAK